LKKLAAGLLIIAAMTVPPALAENGVIKIGAMFISSGKMDGYGIHGNQAIQLAVYGITGAAVF